MVEVHEELLDFREGGNRPGVVIHPKLLIIHRTGNPGSTARQNRNYFNTERQQAVYASAHYCVDAEEIIRCIPEEEMAYHCVGQNRVAIGIELCEPLVPEAWENFLELVVDICLRRDWSWTSEYILPHSRFDPARRPHDPFSWKIFETGGRDPRDLFDGREFYTAVRDRLAAAGGRA